MNATAKKKSSYHHGNLREALVAQSIEILEKEGLAGLSMREVARRLEVSQTAPLHHFESKTGLLAAVAAQGFRLLFDQRIGALKGKGAPEERLLAVMVAFADFAMAHPALFQLMHGPDIPDKTKYPELNDAAIRSYGLLESTVADYLLAHDGHVERSREATLAAWTVCQGLATILTNQQNTPRSVLRKDPLGLSERIIQIFMAGLGATSAAGPAG